MRFYLGIDPGASGALAFYDPALNDLEIHDVPTFQIKTNGKKKNHIDLYALAGIVDKRRPEVKLALIENVGSMPKQGVTSSFNFGFVAGCCQMVVAANFIPMKLVTPAVWKRAMGLTSDKDTAFREASRIFPRHADKWARKKDDGRAEASLLAYYAFKHFGEKTSLADFL